MKDEDIPGQYFCLQADGSFDYCERYKSIASQVCDACFTYMGPSA